MDRRPAYKRMVLGLPRSERDYVSVAFTAELAELLGLDLVGVFAADEDLRDIAALSCVREFRASGDWHRIDAGQLERGSGQAEAQARRLFADAAKATRKGARFDLVKGQIGEAIGPQSAPDDIIVVIEPRNPAERVTYQFTRFLDTAFSSPAAVLLVPSRVVRRSGPIIAVATHELDPCISSALTMAEASHEKLLILAPGADARPLSQLVATSSVPVEQRPIRPGATLAELNSFLMQTAERFVVTGRAVDTRFASQLAAARGVPVLVTEPG